MITRTYSGRQLQRHWFALRFLGCAVAGIVATSPALAQEQMRFATTQAASSTLLEAVKAQDRATLTKIFAQMDSQELTSGDEVQDAAESKAFAEAAEKMNALIKQDDGSYVLHVGMGNWPFPIPLVPKDGQWYWDTRAGKEEIINRRIGENELGAIAVCHGYVLAQREYAQEDRTGQDVLEYAQKLVSTPGKRDGLYWQTSVDEVDSPFGELAARAAMEGYGKSDKPADEPTPYHGYHYRVLTRQGSKASGGKYDYVINGHMVGGFAMVAWPAIYGQSGIMTFVVNQRGKVYQMDLGDKTGELAQKIKEYNPDDSWTLVQE